MLHFFWVFTGCKSTSLVVSRIQRVKLGQIGTNGTENKPKSFEILLWHYHYSGLNQFNPYKPSVLFKGHRQTMQTQILSLSPHCSIFGYGTGHSDHHYFAENNKISIFFTQAKKIESQSYINLKFCDTFLEFRFTSSARSSHKLEIKPSNFFHQPRWKFPSVQAKKMMVLFSKDKQA